LINPNQKTQKNILFTNLKFQQIKMDKKNKSVVLFVVVVVWCNIEMMKNNEIKDGIVAIK
jgi:hypothetical protein